MLMNQNRPVYLNLIKIRLPIPGVMSIIHRITGVVMFLAIPLLIYMLSLSLSSPEGFAEAKALIHSLFGKLVLLGLFWSLIHHLLAGIRYLLIDVDVGVDKPYFRTTAWVVVLLAPVLALILLGAML